MAAFMAAELTGHWHLLPAFLVSEFRCEEDRRTDLTEVAVRYLRRLLPPDPDHGLSCYSIQGEINEHIHGTK